MIGFVCGIAASFFMAGGVAAAWLLLEDRRNELAFGIKPLPVARARSRRSRLDHRTGAWS